MPFSPYKKHPQPTQQLPTFVNLRDFLFEHERSTNLEPSGVKNYTTFK